MGEKQCPHAAAVAIGVGAAYCYQAQLLEGTAHFRVPIEDGIALMELVQGVSELSDGEKDAILRYLPFRSFASKE